MPSCVCLRGAGPVARAIVEAWIAKGADAPALIWAIAPDAPPLQAALRRWGRGPAAVALEGRRLRLADGRALELGSDRAGEVDGAIEIDARSWRATVTKAKAVTRIDPPAVLAATPLLELLERGPGLRWALVEVIEGQREDEPSPAGFGFGDIDAARRELDAAFAKRLPALVGKLAASQLSGPQRGDSLQLCVQLAPRANLEGVRDLLLGHAAPPLEPAAGARSDEALGRDRVLIDGDSIHGIGPLVRVIAHYDPAAMVASAVWIASS